MSETKEKKYIGAIIGLVIAVVATIIGLIIMGHEIEKYDAILDMACNYSGASYSCEQGVKMLKGMSVDDIKNLSPKNWY